MGAQAVKLYGNPPLLQHHAVGIDDIQIADRSLAVLYLRQLRRPGRRLYCGILHLRLLTQYAQAGQTVFHVAERAQYRLTILRNVFLIAGASLITAGLALPAIATRQGQHGSHERTQQKTAAGPREPIAHLRGFIAECRSEEHTSEIKSLMSNS